MRPNSTTFVLWILLAIPSLATAATTSDLYSQTTDAYDKGTLPAIADVQGWWSGHCYFKGEATSPGAQALIAEPVGIGFNVAVIGSVNLSTDLFNPMSVETRTAVQSFIAGADFQREVSRTNSQSLISNSAANEIWVRKVNDGFVAEMVSYAADKTAIIEAACQFSKKIHD